MLREYSEEKVLATYLDAFENLTSLEASRTCPDEILGLRSSGSLDAHAADGRDS